MDEWTPRRKPSPRIFFFKSECDFLWKFNKRGFVLDIISIFTTNFYNYILHLQIGLMFFSEHMNNKIKGDSCFWIGNHLGMVLIKHFPLTFLLCWPYSFSLCFYFSMRRLRALLTGSISTLTFSLLNFTSLHLDNPFPLWLWESLVRLPWFVWHQSASRNLPVPW